MTTITNIGSSPRRLRVGNVSRMAKQSSAIWIAIFVIALIQPGYLQLGGTQLGAPRLLMLLGCVPVLIAYCSGKAGRWLWPDLFFLMYPLWMMVAMAVNHGSNMPVPLVIAGFFETCVPYFLARVLIRDEESFRALFRGLLISLLVITPFAMFESLTNRNILSELYNKVPLLHGFPGTSNPPRMGLERADGVFEHPILYGIYCTVPFSMAFLGLYPKRQMIKRYSWCGLCIFAMIFSVSSGAILSVAIQCMLLGWNWMLQKLRARWKLLIFGAVTTYIGLSLVMDSSPAIYFSTRMTFSGGSAWNRVEILKYGMQNVWANPVFGLGFKDWVRPSYMLPSLDNYWLMTTMRYGIVGFLLHVLGFVGIWIMMSRKDFSKRPEWASLRTAYLITMVAICVVISTVYLWSAIYMLFIFLLGAGAWMASASNTELAEDTGVTDKDKGKAARSPRVLHRTKAAAEASSPRRYNRNHLREPGGPPVATDTERR